MQVAASKARSAFTFGYWRIIRIRCISGINRNIPSFNNNLVKSSPVNNQVFDYRKRFGSPGFNNYGIAILKLAHMQLAEVIFSSGPWGLPFMYRLHIHKFLPCNRDQKQLAPHLSLSTLHLEHPAFPGKNCQMKYSDSIIHKFSLCFAFFCLHIFNVKSMVYCFFFFIYSFFFTSISSKIRFSLCSFGSLSSPVYSQAATYVKSLSSLMLLLRCLKFFPEMSTAGFFPFQSIPCH